MNELTPRQMPEPTLLSTARSHMASTQASILESNLPRRGDIITIIEPPTPGSTAPRIERRMVVLGWDHGVLEVRAV